MTDYNFGDVVLVPFPFTDQTASKKRPAIVVSSSVYNLERPDIVLPAVTSQREAPIYFGDMTVNQWKEAGLLKPSVMKPIFATVEKGLVLRFLGRLGEEDRQALHDVLQEIIG